MSDILISNWVEISKKLGENTAYIQGGGGNTSIKLDDHQMLIKASGVSLQDVSETRGYSIVDYNKVSEYIKYSQDNEQLFNAKVQEFCIGKHMRPSIETGFHAILKKAVIHTHSVYANILTCSVEGKNIAKKLFPKSLWIQYQTPGKDLIQFIANKINSIGEMPDVIFLQNHGIIVTSDSMEKAHIIHNEVNYQIQKYFNDEVMFDINSNIELPVEFIHKNILFPDQVVYTSAGEELLATAAAKETIAAYSFIYNMIQHNKLTPCFISQDKADILLNMESEKYRQNILKKNNDIH